MRQSAWRRSGVRHPAYGGRIGIAHLLHGFEAVGGCAFGILAVVVDEILCQPYGHVTGCEHWRPLPETPGQSF